MSPSDDLLKNLEHLSAAQLRRLLTEQLSRQKLGLYWESSAIERDAALNANIVLPRLSEADSHRLAALGGPGTANLIRQFFDSKTYVFSQDASGQPSGDLFSTARLDATFEFNTQELAFAQSLDRADFVAWWHRNPQGKPYSIALMRSDSRHMFYPDFVVCLQHEPGDEPLIRLVETKHDVKDASRKGRHQSSTYGKVLFLTKDAQRFKIVNDKGSLGEVVDFDNLTRLRQWMRDLAPAA